MASGLSASQAFVLAMIAEHPGSSVNEIAQATMTDRSSAAAIVDRLVEKGFVTRGRAVDDRRRAAVEITARGRRAMSRAAPPPTALLIAALRELPRTKLRALAGGPTSVTRAMGLAHEPPGMLFEENGRATEG